MFQPASPVGLLSLISRADQSRSPEQARFRGESQFRGKIIQSSPKSTDAVIDHPYYRPEFFWSSRKYGPLTFLLVVTVLLMLFWSASGQRWAQPVPAAPKAYAISQFSELPGGPANMGSSRLGGIGQDEARRLNAAIPFMFKAGGSAIPFRFIASETDRARALDCLAIAAMAEAGGGDEGQRAVIQVVLNRVRHPAFAKTICGVVFEGSHRATGCQFTFTCDGALARRFSAVAWERARHRANEALDGRIFAPVGLATHYHTDWVHPYWSSSLVKLARVDTHLFFRWPRYSGTAAAFSSVYHGGEPAIAQIAYLTAHSAAADPNSALPFGAEAIQGAGLRNVVVRNGDGGAFVLLAGTPSATSARSMGREICMARPSCKVLGWFDRAVIPAGYPVSSNARARLGFSYFRDAHDGEIILYDCLRFAGIPAGQCIPSSMVRRKADGPAPGRARLTMTSRPIASGKEGLARSTRRELQPPQAEKDLL